MTTEEKAKKLVIDFGKELALKVIDELLIRDKQWIEKLSSDDPKNWDFKDFTKSEEMFSLLKIEVEKS